jgi:hypothetical protein
MYVQYVLMHQKEKNNSIVRYEFAFMRMLVLFFTSLSFFWNDLSHVCMFLNVLWWKVSMIWGVKLLCTLLLSCISFYCL